MRNTAHATGSTAARPATHLCASLACQTVTCGMAVSKDGCRGVATQPRPVVTASGPYHLDTNPPAHDPTPGQNPVGPEVGSATQWAGSSAGHGRAVVIPISW